MLGLPFGDLNLGLAPLLALGLSSSITMYAAAECRRLSALIIDFERFDGTADDTLRGVAPFRNGDAGGMLVRNSSGEICGPKDTLLRLVADCRGVAGFLFFEDPVKNSHLYIMHLKSAAQIQKFLPLGS